MRIGLDGIVLRTPIAGSHRYFQELVTGLGKYPSEHQFVVFSDPLVLRTEPLPRHSSYRHGRVKARRWEPAALQQQMFAGWEAYGPLDLLHSVVSVPPLGYSIPCVTTVSDLAFDLFPETTKGTGRFWLRLLSRPGITRARRLITLSHGVKRDLCKRFNVSSEKVRVVYPCTREIFQPSPNGRDQLRRYNLPMQYILHVGTLEPRKNIPTLIRAYAEARQRAHIEHALVLAGQRGWQYDSIFQVVEELGLQEHVIFLGFVADEDMPVLYSHADVLAYVSLYEGFGLPALEAMACGTPVLASTASSIPEVVGDAGILVDPYSVETIAAELVRVLGDRDLRMSLRERGLDRARLFSQERFIRQTLAVYDEALHVPAKAAVHPSHALN